MTNAEIQVGEYVRTTSGFIAKCIEKDEYNLDFDDSVRVSYGELWSNLYPSENDVLNHSFNIIDLIEAGDYVNGIEVEAIGYDEDENGKLFDVLGLVYVDDEYAYRKELKDINIYSIVTKEQFESMEYEVVKEQ